MCFAVKELGGEGDRKFCCYGRAAVAPCFNFFITSDLRGIQACQGQLVHDSKVKGRKLET